MAGDREELVDLRGVAAALGITYKSARNYLGWGKLGEPDVRLSNIPGWYRSTVDRLVAERAVEREARRRQEAPKPAPAPKAEKSAAQRAEADRAIREAARRAKRAAAARAKRKKDARARARAPVPLPGPDHEAAREMFG